MGEGVSSARSSAVAVRGVAGKHGMCAAAPLPPPPVPRTLISSASQPRPNVHAGLAQREASNPQFYFLKPTHSMFSFFTALADAYSAVLMPDKDNTER